MTRYTVFDPQDSSNAERHLTAREAVHAILTHNGSQYEIRYSEEGMLEIWSKNETENMPWSDTIFCIKPKLYNHAISRQVDIDALADQVDIDALADQVDIDALADQVIRWTRDQTYGRTVLTDEEYDIMINDDEAYRDL